MKKGSTFFLKIVVLLLGLAALAACVFVLPKGIITDETGYYRPILLGMYVSAIPFFYALYEGRKLLGYIDENKAFSNLTVESLQNIKYSSLIIGAMYTLGLPYIYYAAEKDDSPGVIVLGLIIIFASIVVSTFAAVLQRLLEDAINIKSENDLTV